jgi:methyltransferase (TIGR00027 family)
LASFSLKFLKPSCSDLSVASRVPAERLDEIRTRFAAGEAQLVPLEVRFTDDTGQPVAEGAFVYFLRHSASVAPRDKRPAGMMHMHLSKSSARLVASMRAREAERPSPLFDDPWSAIVAGPHGKLIGDRFVAVLPELQAMVAARTRHLDDVLRAALSEGLRQVVLVGSGLDCRPARFAEHAPDVTWFELDLPHMLEERRQAFSTLKAPAWRRVEVPFNLLTDEPLAALTASTGFDPTAPAFVVYEGCSMYFAADDARRIFTALGALTAAHPQGRLWLDFVSARVARGGEGADPSVRRFLDEMARLGEPFVSGVDASAELAAACGLSVQREDRSGLYQAAPPPLFEEYRFAVLGPPSARQPFGGTTS